MGKVIIFRFCVSDTTAGDGYKKNSCPTICYKISNIPWGGRDRSSGGTIGCYLHSTALLHQCLHSLGVIDNNSRKYWSLVSMPYKCNSVLWKDVIACICLSLPCVLSGNQIFSIIPYTFTNFKIILSKLKALRFFTKTFKKHIQNFALIT